MKGWIWEQQLAPILVCFSWLLYLRQSAFVAAVLQNNAVVAFIVSLIGCALLYYGFSAISKLPALSNGPDYYTEMLGIDFHYRSISRGLIDTRDIVYFLSVILLFLSITNRNLLKR